VLYVYWENIYTLEGNKVMKYKVYVIDSDACYHGKSLVGAESADEANKFIDNFVHNDPHNHGDSWGYCHVDEDDVVEGVYAEHKGILYYGIHYSG
jgi:hypothetical protein